MDIGTLYLNFGSDVVDFGRNGRQRSKGGPFAKPSMMDFRLNYTILVKNITQNIKTFQRD